MDTKIGLRASRRSSSGAIRQSVCTNTMNHGYQAKDEAPINSVFNTKNSSGHLHVI